VDVTHYRGNPARLHDCLLFLASTRLSRTLAANPLGSVGLEFLYSRNRLNVATSRARCACVLVASPRLFEPECRTPRQMHLANSLCRYLELAQVVSG
jgi:hypothetical protein